jgi:hypothetical protein
MSIVNIRMRQILACLLLTAAAAAQQMPHEDVVRINEFYRLAAQSQDQIWPDWSKVPAPLLLVTDKTEFLTHDSAPPKDFTKVGEDVYARPRQFSVDLQATFPAFGPPAVIVIGQPQNTRDKTSTPWLITVMHEHFHQLQSAQPGYDDDVAKLNLSGNDESGMWMLNYPFPYDKPEVDQAFAKLRDLLLNCLAQTEAREFKQHAAEYTRERKKVFAQLSANDHKYFSFQLWQEGIARYTQVKSAEAAANYRPTAEFSALPDYESFASYAARARTETLNELQKADLARMKRVYVYSFGAAEGFFLDRWNPGWKSQYFKHPLSTDALFEVESR